MSEQSSRRQFLKGIGLFSILAGAGRIWKVTRPPVVRPTTVLVPARDWSQFASPTFEFLPSFQDFLMAHKEGRA